MAHAAPRPFTYGPKATHNLPSPAKDSQAAERAAYIESLLAGWPEPTPQQQRTVSSLLSNATPAITVADWVKFENKRYIEATETPGIHGTYGNEVAA